MNTDLSQTAKEIVSRTILAADESTGTIKKRFATIGVESNPEVNRKYRQLLFTAPGVERFVSGVILYDETLRQSTDAGDPFPKLLTDKGIVPGIKVDQGTEKFAEDRVDTYTKGVESLEGRYPEYRSLGARFAKWRAVYTIADDAPTSESIERNAQDLAMYAKISQDASIVPIVEPEVLMEGEHSFEKNREVTAKVLAAVFAQLKEKGVNPGGIILKPNMITAGKNNAIQKSVEEVAQATLDVLKEIVPSEVPGIAFLSGGQSPDLATEHLNAMNKIKNASTGRWTDKYPWRLTASYGRALQGEALEAWGGKDENIEAAQKVFITRAEKVYKASLGKL